MIRCPVYSIILMLSNASVSLVSGQVQAHANFAVPFQVPRQLGHAELKDSAFVGDAMAYRYRGPGITGLDFYVWPLPGDSLTRTAEDSLLKFEVAKFTEAAPVGLQRGWYDDYKIAFGDSHPIALDADSLPGYVVALAFARRGQRFVSFFYIYALHGMYIKIRLTVPGENWGSNEALDLPAVFIQDVARQR